MPALRQLIITHFKNYDHQSFDFHNRVIGICGLNGRGKTNLLDAIYYCCFTKSYFTSSDSQNVKFEKEGFRLQALFEKEDLKNKVICIYRGLGRKEFLLNDVPYEKLSKHIGLLPAVIIAPDDIEIITGTSEVRRRFVDALISQIDNEYLQQLMQYNRVLQQRNSLLKQFAEKRYMDAALLDILDQQLVTPANYIHKCRKEICLELRPLTEEFYKTLSSDTEIAGLVYESHLHTSEMKTLLSKNSEKDRMLQRTSAGIHRDELTFTLNNNPFKSVASQGQRKSMLFALKLAEFQILKKYKGFAPILLLDDVFEKLDEKRMNHLLHWVCNYNEGQVFITDTHRERLEKAFAQLAVAAEIIEL